MTHHQPLFYNDEHAQRLLREAPRFFNIFVGEAIGISNPTHIASQAFSKRSIANQVVKTRFNGRAKYRIVVRLKTKKAGSLKSCLITTT